MGNQTFNQLAAEIRREIGRVKMKKNVRRVFDCILEQSLDAGRDYCVLPLKFFSAYSGMPKSHAGAALKELVSLQVVTRPSRWLFVPTTPNRWSAPQRTDFASWAEVAGKVENLNRNLSFSEVKYLPKAITDLFDQEELNLDKVLLSLPSNAQIHAPGVTESVTLGPERASSVPESGTPQSETVRENSPRGSSVTELVTEDWREPGALTRAYQKAVRLETVSVGAGSEKIGPAVPESVTPNLTPAVPVSGTPSVTETVTPRAVNYSNTVNYVKDLKHSNNVTLKPVTDSVTPPPSVTKTGTAHFDEELYREVQKLQGRDWNPDYRYFWAKVTRYNPDLVREVVSETRYRLQTARAHQRPVSNVAAFMKGVLANISKVSMFIGGILP